MFQRCVETTFESQLVVRQSPLQQSPGNLGGNVGSPRKSAVAPGASWLGIFWVIPVEWWNKICRPFRPTEMSSVFGITYDLIGKNWKDTVYTFYTSYFIHSPLASVVIDDMSCRMICMFCCVALKILSNEIFKSTTLTRVKLSQ